MQVLYESATGLALFSSEFAEEIGSKGSRQVQQSIDEVSKFSKMVKLVSFTPFQDAGHALEVANDISEGGSDCVQFSTFNHTCCLIS